MAKRGMTESKQCPFCKKWVPLPIRLQKAAFEAHKAACDPAGHERGEVFRKELLGG